MLAYSPLDHAAFSLGERREPQPPSYLVRSHHNAWPWRSPRQTERPNDRICQGHKGLGHHDAAGAGEFEGAWQQTELGSRGRSGKRPGKLHHRTGRQFPTNLPETGKNPFGRPIFQNNQYSDTPTQPLVAMQFVDMKAEPGKKHSYRVIAVNTVGMKSKPSE